MINCSPYYTDGLNSQAARLATLSCRRLCQSGPGRTRRHLSGNCRQPAWDRHPLTATSFDVTPITEPAAILKFRVTFLTAKQNETAYTPDAQVEEYLTTQGE